MDPIAQWLSYAAGWDRILSMVGIEIHWVILQYVLGLPLVILIALLAYSKTKNKNYFRLARTLTKALGLVFAVGAAMGTASEFGLVLLWPNLTEAAGRYIYFPLYAEIFAFLMEIVFIYLLVFGWNKLSDRARIAVALLAMIGAWYSAAMIVSVNSYMVAPTGIVAAYNPVSGNWRYNEGYPKILLVVPNNIVAALDVGKLQGLGMEVVGKTADAVIVLMPSKIVQRLAWEAWNNVYVKDSILMLVLSPTAKSNQALLNTPVKNIVDAILVRTVKYVGPYTVTFQSPVYLGSILHAIGAALTVTGFTLIGVYALRLLTAKDEEYRKYLKDAFRLAVYFSLIAIILQGFVFGHFLGEEIANYNPEKLAAMEGTSTKILSLSRLTGADRLMPLIIYGDSNAKLPNYDQIPENYCYLQSRPGLTDCRPPLLVHYLYYTKTGLGILLGLDALLLAFYLYRHSEIPRMLLEVNIAAPFIVHIVSFLGWATREIGRKPWTIYGVMTVDVAHTPNPAPPAIVLLVAVYFIALLVALGFAVWKILYIPSLKEEV